MQETHKTQPFLHFVIRNLWGLGNPQMDPADTTDSLLLTEISGKIISKTKQLCENT